MQLLQHGEARKSAKPEQTGGNCSKLTTQQPLLIHVKLPLEAAIARAKAPEAGTATG